MYNFLNKKDSCLLVLLSLNNYNHKLLNSKTNYNYKPIFNIGQINNINTNNVQQDTTLNNKQSLRNKIWYGIKSGWDLPTLPDHIIKLNKRIPLRLLRFIGPVSMFTIVSGIGRQFNNSFIYYTIVVISLLYIFYKYLIIYYTIKQWFHHLFNGDFIVRKGGEK